MRPPANVDPLGRITRLKTLRRGRVCPKQAYASKKHAKAVAAHQSKLMGEVIEAYHCFTCHAFHIGHPPKGKFS